MNYAPGTISWYEAMRNHRANETRRIREEMIDLDRETRVEIQQHLDNDNIEDAQLVLDRTPH